MADVTILGNTVFVGVPDLLRWGHSAVGCALIQ